MTGTNPGYLDMFDLVSGKMNTFLDLTISDEMVRSLKAKAKDTLSLAFDTISSPGSATINPSYKDTSESKAKDRSVTVDFWFTLFEMDKPPPDSVIPEIVFKFYRQSEVTGVKHEFPLRFKKSPKQSPDKERIYYNVNIPIKPKDSSAGYKLKNLWNGDQNLPVSEADLTEHHLLSKQWYYFRVSLVRYYEVKSYYLQVLIYSPSNPEKIILFLDKDISSKIEGMTVN